MFTWNHPVDKGLEHPKHGSPDRSADHHLSNSYPFLEYRLIV